MKQFLCPWYHVDEYRLDLIVILTKHEWYFGGICECVLVSANNILQIPSTVQLIWINGIFCLKICTICYQFTTIADSKLDYFIEYLSQCSDIWLVVRILLLQWLLILFIISIFIWWRWHLFLRAALNIGHWHTL